MDTLVVLFVIIAVIANLSKKSKEKAAKEKAKQARAQQAQRPRQAQPRPAQPQRPATQQTTMEDIFPWVTPEPPKPAVKPGQPAKPARPPEGQSAGGSLGGPFTEGRATQGSMAASSTEGLGTAEGMASAEGVGMGGSLGGTRPKPTANRRNRHVVQPFTEGNHQHTESSMTGVAPCPPAQGGVGKREAASVPVVPRAVGQYNLSFDRNSLITGFLYGEILGKPRSLAPRNAYRR